MRMNNIYHISIKEADTRVGFFYWDTCYIFYTVPDSAY